MCRMLVHKTTSNDDHRTQQLQSIYQENSRLVLPPFSELGIPKCTFQRDHIRS